MKIEKYVRALLPNFEKRRMIEDMRNLIAELRDITIPSYEKAGEVFKGGHFTSETARQFDKECKERIALYRINHINTIHRGLSMALINAEAVIGIISKEYANDIMREGITYVIANHLQFIEVVSFASEYARRWLLHLFGLESMRLEDRDYYEKTAMLREQKYLDANRNNFINAIRIVSRTPERLHEALDSVPDIIVDPDNAIATAGVVGASRLDPLQFNLIPVGLNPIYYVRLAYSEWQANRYHILREESKQIELRILFMKQAKSSTGTRDAKLEQQIEYSEQRLEKLRFKLHRMENIDE